VSRDTPPGQTPQTESDLQLPDPAQRRRAVLLLLVAALLGALLISQVPALLAAVERWIVRDPAQQAARLGLVMVALWLLLALPTLAFAASVWRLARRIAEAERFPPPGSATVRSVRVRHGKRALRFAAGARALALLLLVAVLALAGILARLTTLLSAPPP
jgi:hypothetical protein